MTKVAIQLDTQAKDVFEKLQNKKKDARATSKKKLEWLLASWRNYIRSLLGQ